MPSARSRGAGAPSSPSTAPRRSCRSPTRARWDRCSTTRATRSSMPSARAASSARSASRRPTRAGGRRSAWARATTPSRWWAPAAWGPDRHYGGGAPLGFGRRVEPPRASPPDAAAACAGPPAETIVRFARRYGAGPRSFIRIGIGLSRHDNGGMTCRTLACLPALTGAYADPHGGALLSSGEAPGFDFSVLERPDLLPRPAPRVVNMIQLGRALTDPALAPPVKALYVSSSNPAAVCPHQTLVLEGRAREDPFTG